MQRGFMEDLKTDPRARYGDMLACRDWSVEDRAGELAIPCLIVTGEDEEPETQKSADALASRISDALRMRIPKAGHLLHLETPEALTKTVTSFLEGLPS